MIHEVFFFFIFITLTLFTSECNVILLTIMVHCKVVKYITGSDVIAT